MVITTPWAIMRDYDGNNHPVGYYEGNNHPVGYYEGL